MSTSFTKQEQVMFDKMVEGFDDMLVIAKGFDLYEAQTEQQAVNARDKFWVPMPMIGASYDGFDQTANFAGLTELNVPASVGFHKSVPKTLSSKNLRNQYALDNYGLSHWAMSAAGSDWPVTYEAANVVRVRYMAGSTTLDPAVKAAIMLTVGHLYENRQEATEKKLVSVPLGVNALLDTVKVWGI